MISQAVPQLQGVELLRKTDTVAHVQPRREVFSEHERGVVGEEIRLDAHVLDTEA